MGLNYQYIKLKADDLLEYLLLVLPAEKNISNLKLSDETYSLSFVYSGDFGRIGLAIDLYEDEKNSSVLNFRK
jgi:hypothetical protein